MRTFKSVCWIIGILFVVTMLQGAGLPSAGNPLNWGEQYNEFLLVEHEADGFHRSFTGPIGIGTVLAVTDLEISSATDGEKLLLHTFDSTTGKYTGMLFKVSANTADEFQKGGVLFERTGLGGVGKLHLAVNNVGDASNVDLSDVKVTINEIGRMGIGTTDPDKLLHVAGSAVIDGDLIARGPWSDVVAYGASGDGSDDSTPFANAVAASGDQHVRVPSPPSSYLINAWPTIPTDSHVTWLHDYWSDADPILEVDGTTGGWFADWDLFSARKLIVQTDEDLTSIGGESFRDAYFIQMQDVDDTDYTLIGQNVTHALRVYTTGRYESAAWQDQYKDLVGALFVAQGNISWDARGVSGLTAEAIQMGLGICSNEFAALNPSAANGGLAQSVSMAAGQFIIKNQYAAEDPSHISRGILINSIGESVTAAVYIASTVQDGFNSRFKHAIYMPDAEITSDGSAIIMPASQANDTGTVIQYDPDDYSDFQRSNNKFRWIVGGTPILTVDGDGVVVDGTIGTTGTISGGADIAATGLLSGANISTGGFVSATGAVSGGSVASGGTLSATGNFSINTNKFTIDATTGGAIIAGTLTVGGESTYNGNMLLGPNVDLVGSGTSGISLNTNKFTVDGVTGDTVIAGTLNVSDTLTIDAAVGRTIGILTTSASQSVAGHDLWETSGAMTTPGITNLIGGVTGQEITILFLHSTFISSQAGGAGQIYLEGGNDFTFTGTSNLTLVRWDDGAWYQKSRMIFTP